MSLSDGELMSLWLRRNQRWVAMLETARREQIDRLGRKIGPVHWIGSPEFGPWTWLGFFWESERFWFGYGYDGKGLSLLIEADASYPAAGAWDLLRKQMPDVWNYSRTGKYLRVVAGAELPTGKRSHLLWLRARSHELHEFTLSH